MPDAVCAAVAVPTAPESVSVRDAECCAEPCDTDSLRAAEMLAEVDCSGVEELRVCDLESDIDPPLRVRVLSAVIVALPDAECVDDAECSLVPVAESRVLSAVPVTRELLTVADTEWSCVPERVCLLRETLLETLRSADGETVAVRSRVPVRLRRLRECERVCVACLTG